ncbi:MAG: hypothetical protein ACTHN3_06475 [Solirubrobacterales bacterium]
MTQGKFKMWLVQWGFASLVGLAVFAAAYVAWKAAVPAQVPDFALKAEALYRIEIGVNGLKAQDMANEAQQSAIEAYEESLDSLQRMIDALAISTGESVEDLTDRLEALESADSGLYFLGMQESGNSSTPRRRPRSSDDPMVRLREVMDKARKEFNASRERGRRAVAEADAALKLRSR